MSWLILYTENQATREQIAKDLAAVPGISLDSRLYVATWNHVSKTSLLLFEVYRKFRTAADVVVNVVDVESNVYIWERRKNLSGVDLRVAFTPSEPYVAVQNEV